MTGEQSSLRGYPVLVDGHELPWPVALVDFDGVLANYGGFLTSDRAGVPLPDASDLLLGLRAEGWSVVVHSARQAKQVREWLDRYGFSGLVDAVSPVKVPGILIDDRCVRYSPSMSVDRVIAEAARPAWWDAGVDVSGWSVEAIAPDRLTEIAHAAFTVWMSRTYRAGAQDRERLWRAHDDLRDRWRAVVRAVIEELGTP